MSPDPATWRPPVHCDQRSSSKADAPQRASTVRPRRARPGGRPPGYVSATSSSGTAAGASQKGDAMHDMSARSKPAARYRRGDSRFHDDGVTATHPAGATLRSRGHVLTLLRELRRRDNDASHAIAGRCTAGAWPRLSRRSRTCGPTRGWAGSTCAGTRGWARSGGRTA